MRYLICYDITDDKKRRKVADILEAYGLRVQKSAFEVDVNEKELDRLIECLQKICKNESIRFYHLCRACIKKSFALSSEADPFEFESIFFH